MENKIKKLLSIVMLTGSIFSFASINGAMASKKMPPLSTEDKALVYKDDNDSSEEEKKCKLRIDDDSFSEEKKPAKTNRKQNKRSSKKELPACPYCGKEDGVHRKRNGVYNCQDCVNKKGPTGLNHKGIFTPTGLKGACGYCGSHHLMGYNSIGVYGKGIYTCQTCRTEQGLSELRKPLYVSNDSSSED